MSSHAKLSPSGSKRWMTCPGSLTLERSFPNTSNKYSDEGTAMHEVAQACIRRKLKAAGYVGAPIVVSNSSEPERTVVFTEEMAELTQGYVDTVNALAKGHELFVEQRVEFSEFIGVEDQFGTADATILNAADGELMAIDLKTGHTPVEVESNSQLMLYALGVLAMLRDQAMEGDLAG